MAFHRPALGFSLFALLCVTVFGALGAWQLERLEWKTGIVVQRHARLTAPPIEPPPANSSPQDIDHRRIQVVGNWLPEALFEVGRIPSGGGLFTRLVKGFELSDGRAMLVEVGEFPVARMDARVDRELVPIGPDRFEAVIKIDRGPGLFGSDAPPKDGVWTRVAPEVMGTTIGLNVIPYYATRVERSGGFESLTAIPNNHLSYAITWFAVMAAVIVLFGVSCWRRD